MTTYYSEFQKVLLSVDCIIFGFDNNKLKILIGKRNMDPGRGEWSLYGGFVRSDESLDKAAHRTLRELTGLRNVFMRQVGAFGNLDRDPGERVVSVAYYALINVKDYSERQCLPVLMRVTTRMAHSRAVVVVKDEARPENTMNYNAVAANWVLLPANARRRNDVVTKQQAQLEEDAVNSSYNKLTFPSTGGAERAPPGRARGRR